MFDEDIKFDYIEIWIDPAFSEKTKSDTFWIVCSWFKKVENVIFKYLLDVVWLAWDKKSNENVCREVLNLYLTHKPRIIKVEKNNWWEIFAKMFMNQSLMWGYNLPIEVINTTKDKFTRLKEFEGCFQRWEVYFKVGKTEQLIDQLLDFTWEPWKPDDLVDAMVNSFSWNWFNFYFDII